MLNEFQYRVLKEAEETSEEYKAYDKAKKDLQKEIDKLLTSISREYNKRWKEPTPSIKYTTKFIKAAKLIKKANEIL